MFGTLAMIATAQAAAVPSEPADSIVRQFVVAITSGDRNAFERLAPELIMMVTPDFGVPSAFADVSKTFGDCQFDRPERPQAVEGIESVSSVHIAMTCPATSRLNGRHGLVLLVSNGKVGGIVPQTIWASYKRH